MEENNIEWFAEIDVLYSADICHSSLPLWLDFPIHSTWTGTLAWRTPIFIWIPFYLFLHAVSTFYKKAVRRTIERMLVIVACLQVNIKQMFTFNKAALPEVIRDFCNIQRPKSIKQNDLKARSYYCLFGAIHWWIK